MAVNTTCVVFVGALVATRAPIGDTVECATMRHLARTMLLWCCVHAPTLAASDTLPEPLALSLQRLHLGTSGLSLYVHEIGSAEPLLAFAADAPRSPASVIKLLPTLAALEELGPAYRWQTQLWSVAPVREGKLEGDLYIKGNGDPYLVIEHFWRLLRRLRQAGVVSIEGDLVIDQSYFDPEPEDPVEFDGKPQRAYNVQPAALLVNFQTVHFRFMPDDAERRVRILAEPWPAQVGLENNLRLTRGACGWWMSHLGMRTLQREDRESVVFSGSYDAACGEREMFRVVADPVSYLYGVFRSLWSEMGGRLTGGVREAVVPPQARRLAVLDSPPLADTIRLVNKHSNNVMTRQLLLTLGAVHGGPPGTTGKGIAAVEAWLRKRGLEYPGLVLENGSGLSRHERISARQLGALLHAAYASPVMPEFLSSLPLTGVDGTVRRRFNGTELAGRAHLKTGTIDDVNAIAGYVLDRNNRRVVVVVLLNHRRADTGVGSAFQDAVLEWVYQR